MMLIHTSFTSIKVLLAFAAALLCAGASHAQQVALALPGQRVLGERHLGADAGLVDVDAFDEQGYAVGFGLSVPVTPYLDLGAHVGHGWIDEAGIGLKDSTVSATAVVHGTAGGVRPFAGVLLGHQRLEMDVGRFGTKDRCGIWGGGVGVEIPVGRGSISPSIAYTDSFDGTTDRTTHFTLHGNYWVTAKLAGYLDVTYADFSGDGDNAWVYRLGLRWKF